MWYIYQRGGSEIEFMVRMERSSEIPKRGQKIPSGILYDEVGFRHESSEAAAEAFADKTFRCCVYGRIAHPNTNALAEVFRELEQGEDAVILSSGMAATTTIALALCQSGDRLVSSSRIYGGTYGLFNNFLPQKNNIETTFVTNPEDLSQWQKAIESARPPKIVFLETPGNPLLGVYNIEAVSDLAHKSGAVSVVDNTMGIGIQKPLVFNADISLSSLTKVPSGGKRTGGVVIGSKDLILKCLNIRQFMGFSLDHEAAFKMMRSACTIEGRMKKHSRNALLLTQLISSYGYKVYYPGLSSKYEHSLVKKQMGGFGGCLLSFETKHGGQKEAMKLLNILHDQEALDIVTHFGEEKVTTGVHPASTTHSGMDAQARQSAGISDRLIRISASANRDFAKSTYLKFKEALNIFEKDVRNFYYEAGS